MSGGGAPSPVDDPVSLWGAHLSIHVRSYVDPGKLAAPMFAT